ncbi:EFR1 family ferrodoxin [candidate division KSB1 bacterium]|nr:EFR1 family ferrodoxin [candidate division KSB1 bacterium]
MSTTLFYYTGTGNSLWVARKLAEALGETELIPIANFELDSKPLNSETMGLIFPVYIWGVSAPVLRFIDTLAQLKPQYLFAVATNGGQVANTLVQLQKVLAHQNLKLNAGFSITLPSNYIPWGGPGPVAIQQQKFQAATEKIPQIAAVVKAQKTQPVEKGPRWQRLVYSAFYKLSFNQVPKMDGQFWVDDKCNQCEICQKVCPANNITLVEGKPVWNHRCEQCYACLQWCPQQAIQYGQKTPQYERYHHPEIKLKDVLKRD